MIMYKLFITQGPFSIIFLLIDRKCYAEAIKREEI